jgi:hypothetical protein
MDLGVIGEWMYDTCEDEATTAFKNVFLGGCRISTARPGSYFWKPLVDLEVIFS